MVGSVVVLSRSTCGVRVFRAVEACRHTSLFVVNDMERYVLSRVYSLVEYM